VITNEYLTLPLHGELMLSVKIQSPFKKLARIQVGDSLSTIGFKYSHLNVDLTTPTAHYLDTFFSNPNIILGTVATCPQYITLPSGALLALFEIEGYPEAIQLTTKLLGQNFKMARSE
jgi:hypothetical protein